METTKYSFMDLNLTPGQVMQLEFEGYTASRDRAVLIGYRNNGSLIVTTPIVQGVPANVKNGEQVNVRFFAGKKNSACAFTSEVIYSSKSPYPHIHLKIPDHVLMEEVRRSVRAEVEVVAKVNFFNGSDVQTTSAKIVDLSLNGARMIGRTFDFEKDSDVLLIFRIEVTGIEYEMNIKARARSITDIENGIAVGLQFEDIPANDKIALQAFVLSKVHDQ
jgi:c-di-GMP-binding flagellar brake protein YcgR